MMSIVRPVTKHRLSLPVSPGVRWLSLLVAAWIGTAGAADSPREWLERMVSASGQVSFRGTLVHMCGGKVDVVNIIHRVEEGRITERVKALDADGREIIRNPDEVMCILPDQQTVMVGSRQGADRHVDALLTPPPSFARVSGANYRLQMLGEEHVAGQATEVIAIRSTDNYRYGYRLWLDRQSAMALKYELIGADGTALEQTLFTEIEFSDRIARSEVQPTVAMDNFIWQRSGGSSSGDAAEPASAVAGSATPGAWHATEMPAGFALVTTEIRSGDGGDAQLEHLVYSDGLASVSVFIEAEVNEAERQPGRSEMGAMNAYTTMVDGFLVTAVGAVPIRTARMIALSVEPVVVDP